MKSSATVNYHINSQQTQAFQFDVDGVIGNLISPELVPTKVFVEDLRGDTDSVCFQDDGIVFHSHISKVANFNSSMWREIYDEELRGLLKMKIAAEEVIVFDHTVRIDDANADRKPARNVHNDYSMSGAQQRLIDLIGERRAEEYEKGHYGFVNVWRPVEHTIKTSPLGFIKPASIEPNDWMVIELIYPDRIGQILGLAANKHHDWFYLSNMTPDEIVIFNIYDNRGRPCLGHSALDMENSETERSIPRMSIESRTLVKYS